MEKKNYDLNNLVGQYQYGFKTNTKIIASVPRGLNKDIIKQISKLKNEPQWMTDYRLKSYEQFLKSPLPKDIPDISFIQYQDYIYFVRASDSVVHLWNQVPESIRNAFDKLGVLKAEKKFLSAVSTQFESEVVYNNCDPELVKQGVIYCDTDTALREHEEIFKKHFGTLVPPSTNKYAALNGAVWSGGTFIYIPKGVKVKKPLQSYYRINTPGVGQFERTMMIIEEGGSLNYVEGCTAPTKMDNSLHVSTVEIFVGKNAHCRISAIQNWSTSITNLVNSRAKCEEGAFMEWIDGNIGSGLNIKYPTTVLAGRGAKAVALSIAFASKDQHQDTGAKMIHEAPYTSSTIISKSISRAGGRSNYRGIVSCDENSDYAKSHIECDTIIVDGDSKSDTLPINIVNNAKAIIEHEACVSKVSDEQLFYLMSRGIEKEEAMQMIILGFVEPLTKELPMEYAVELNRLIRMNMVGSIG